MENNAQNAISALRTATTPIRTAKARKTTAERMAAIADMVFLDEEVTHDGTPMSRYEVILRRQAEEAMEGNAAAVGVVVKLMTLQREFEQAKEVFEAAISPIWRRKPEDIEINSEYVVVKNEALPKPDSTTSGGEY